MTLTAVRWLPGVMVDSITPDVIQSKIFSTSRSVLMTDGWYHLRVGATSRCAVCGAPVNSAHLAMRSSHPLYSALALEYAERAQRARMEGTPHAR